MLGLVYGGGGGCRAFQTVGIGGRVISINYGRRHLLWVGGRGLSQALHRLNTEISTFNKKYLKKKENNIYNVITSA